MEKGIRDDSKIDENVIETGSRILNQIVVESGNWFIASHENIEDGRVILDTIFSDWFIVFIESVKDGRAIVDIYFFDEFIAFIETFKDGRAIIDVTFSVQSIAFVENVKVDIYSLNE